MSEEVSGPTYDVFEVPALGEIKARQGTAIHEIVGAAAYWHKKAKTAYNTGFVSGGLFAALTFTIGYAFIYYLRSR